MEAHLALAYCDFWGRSDYPSALEHLARAQALAPQSAEVLVALGAVYRRQLRFDELSPCTSVPRNTIPEIRKLFYDLATTCLWAGRNDKVQPTLERALALNPVNESAAAVLGEFLFRQRGDVEGARRVLSGRGPTAQITLADTYWLTRDYEKAIRLIEELPADSPAFGPVTGQRTSCSDSTCTTPATSNAHVRCWNGARPTDGIAGGQNPQCPRICVHFD